MIVAALLALNAAAQPLTLAKLSKGHRVLIVTAPASTDGRLTAQERHLRQWSGARDRDVLVFEIVADGAARGFDDDPADIRRRLGLRRDRFGVVLIGKDGHVALRSAKPISGMRLQAAIDAMPMRRAGLR